MSNSFTWHPDGYAYHAEALTGPNVSWVRLKQGKGENRQECVFFFQTLSQARAVAAAFNDGPQPQIDDGPQHQTNGDPDGPDN